MDCDRRNVSHDPASLSRMTDDELQTVLSSAPKDSPLAEQVKVEMQGRLADRQALRRNLRGFVDLAAIACWIALWVARPPSVWS